VVRLHSEKGIKQMAAVGGSIESVSIRGRTFPVAADADANRKLGGFETEVQANGDGTARKILTRVPWQIDGLQLEIDDDRGDQEFLQAVANEKDFVAVAITFASGITYQGRGTITAELQFSSQNATAGVTLMGPGEMTKQ
jgi:hypothetical protein